MDFGVCCPLNLLSRSFPPSLPRDFLSPETELYFAKTPTIHALAETTTSEAYGEPIMINRPSITNTA